jgi:hypothetical protein
MDKAVLFLIFNRLDTAKAVFEQIRIAKPSRLYIASDGPREEKDGEEELVGKVRQYVLDNIDWPCETKTLFRDKNLGCGVAIYKAINWFFEHEEDGIILEDDCVPNQSFFRFCSELLDKYKDDFRIWQISGNGYYKDINAKSSYYFSKIPQCWGWATWANRWKHFEFDVSNFDRKKLEYFSDRKEVQNFWQNILNYLEKGKNDIWDYNWVFTIVGNKGYCIDPYVHLVSNIGIEGTHFNGENDLLNVQKEEIGDIIHPIKIEYNEKAINYIYKYMFNIREARWSLLKKEKIGNKRVITILGFIKISYRKKDKINA